MSGMGAEDNVDRDTGENSILEPTSHPIVRYLWPLGPDASPKARLAAVFEAYTEATGIQLPSPMTPDTLRHVGQWLHDEDSNMPVDENGHSGSLLYTRHPRLAPLISPNLANKVGWLQQARCPTCIPADLRPMAISFSVRVRPFSAQSLKGSKRGRLKLNDLKQKIATDMAQRNLDIGAWSGYGLCVAIVAITPKQERLKDVDNTVKGLLDALHGSVYEDDQQIQHVSVQRVLNSARDGWYMLQVMPVLDARADVVDRVLRVGWAGQAEIVAEIA